MLFDNAHADICCNLDQDLDVYVSFANEGIPYIH